MEIRREITDDRSGRLTQSRRKAPMPNIEGASNLQLPNASTERPATVKPDAGVGRATKIPLLLRRPSKRRL